MCISFILLSITIFFRALISAGYLPFDAWHCPPGHGFSFISAVKLLPRCLP